MTNAEGRRPNAGARTLTADALVRVARWLMAGGERRIEDFLAEGRERRARVIDPRTAFESNQTNKPTN